MFGVTGDGKCCICDSYVRPHVLVHICDDCNYGSFEVRLLLSSFFAPCSVLCVMFGLVVWFG